MNIKISNGIVQSKQKVVIYGPEGIGKSTLASKFPRPLFIDTEGSTNKLNVQRFEEKPSSWAMLKNYIEYVKQNPDICDTLVIDTMDWAERLCVESVLAAHGKKGIEDFGYGNGYTYAAEEIGRFLNMLQELIDKNICNVVLTAHSQIKHFEQPDEMGSYDRYELKLGKKTTSQTSPLVKEWADMILFCNYETFAVAADKEGKKFKGQGGQRVMYTSHHPCWDAKNRDRLPEKLPMDYAEIAHVIEGGTAPVRENALPDPMPAIAEIEPEPREEKPSEKPETPLPKVTEADLEGFEPIGGGDDLEGLPQALRELMRANNVTEEDIRAAVANKGYFPEIMPVSNYPPDFIDGVLIGAWEQVYAMIMENKTIPF
ncbi:MAG: ATP-binding protein [Prevotella sp.]|nr:ATP-binding protein [Prevotella sp.]